MIRLIIAGPRDYYDRENVFCHIHMFQGKFGIDEIVSGGASGVDTLAEEYANLYQIPFKLFPADWEKYGKAAGPIRNQQMAEYGNVLLAFDRGTKGTKNMIETARSIGVEISKEDAEILAESYACDGEYDCNLSYWNNIENLMEDYIKPEEDITE